MADSDIHGSWALVTGASSGLGVDFARQLASRGANLILVARRWERLRVLAGEIKINTAVDVEVEPLDLADPGAAEVLYRKLDERGHHVEILVNNAGFGVHGSFLDSPWTRDRDMIQVDAIAPLHLTRLFAAKMAKRGFGRILQVASTAAYQPVPTYAVYGACKAFVLSFSQALNYELRGSGVTCTVVSPGVIKTEFQQVAGHAFTRYMRWTQMKSADVARIGIEAMLNGRTVVVPGLHNALLVASQRFAPRRLVTALAGYFMTAGR
ncbi:MAG: SDR family oxidoreductase [Gemmatimonadales bacterium]|jgi:short-subunit dehydrogenase